MRLRVTVCALLGVAFFLFGISLHRAAEKGPCLPDKTWVSVADLDSEGYLQRYGCIGTVFDFRPRHPCVQAVMLPLCALGSRMVHDGHAELVAPLVLAVFAAVAAATMFFLWHVSDDAASVVLYLSFAYAWILGGTADLFTLSEAVLLATLAMVASGAWDWRAWFWMSALAGGITVTNVVKPLLAAFAGGKCPPGALRKCVSLGGVCAAVFAVIVVGLKLLGWAFGFEYGIGSVVSYAWNDITSVLPLGASVSDRLNMFWQAFLCEPMLLHGPIIGVDNFLGGYGSPVPHVLAAAVLAAALCGAVRGRLDPVVRASLAMVAFDFLLHGLVGWGAAEGQIYCGHWFFVIPILVSRLPGAAWKLCLAGGVASWNIRTVASIIL